MAIGVISALFDHARPCSTMFGLSSSGTFCIYGSADHPAVTDSGFRNRLEKPGEIPRNPPPLSLERGVSQWD